MKKYLILLVVIAFSSLALKQDYNDKDLAKKFVKNEKVSFKWASDATFDVPESVFYHKKEDVIYVASIGGEAAEKDGNGFISRLGTDGQIMDLKWVTGLDAPKGMWVDGDYLYVSDIDRLVKINIKQGKVEETFEAKEAKFLNDVAVNSNGEVFVSDSRGNAIYRLSGGTFKVWVSGDDINGPNGLYALKNKLLVGIRGKILSMDYHSGESEEFIDNTGGIDGLVPGWGKHEYLVSNWQGLVQSVHPDRKNEVLVLYTPDKLKAADIDFAKSKKLLLIPTFFDNRVTAYEVSK